jgi:ribosomal protein L20A (L18A)
MWNFNCIRTKYGPAFDLMAFEAQNKDSDWLEVAGTKNASGSFVPLKNQARSFLRMAIRKEEAVEKARKDLAQRLGVSTSEIKEQSVEEAEFPDMSLGAPAKDEMSGQMITTGWRIRLQAGNQSFEYRASKNQVRLYNYRGENHRI